MDDIYFYCFTVISSWFWFLLFPPQITSGYFTWTDGPPTLSNVDIKIPVGEHQAAGWTLPLNVSVFCFSDLSLLSYCTSQANWQWLWVRWVVGNLLCCWRRWGRCSECRGQLPGTGQFCLNGLISHSETLIEHQVASYCGRVATILILMSPDYLKVFFWTEHSLQLTTSQGSFPVTVLYFPNHFNQIASWMRVTLPGWLTIIFWRMLLQFLKNIYM